MLESFYQDRMDNVVVQDIVQWEVLEKYNRN